MKISDIITETTAGAVATVAVPLGGMRKRPNPSVFNKAKKKKTNEGEERSIISNAAVDYLVSNYGDKDMSEQSLYDILSGLDVDDVIDPDMMHGGQRIGDFANGRVIDCCNSSDIIDDVKSQLDMSEGKSPHKKGTKKYKKHMAAMHAG
tara:strand:+ start:897 stop:1343 length:447 start_codon:yes stop_codon:yes gene_type:complete